MPTAGRPSGATVALVAAIVVAAAISVTAYVITAAGSGTSRHATAERNAEVVQQIEQPLQLQRVTSGVQGTLGHGLPAVVAAWVYTFGYWPFLALAIARAAWRHRPVLHRLLLAGACSGLVGVVAMVALPTAPPRPVGHVDVVAESSLGSVAHPDVLLNPYGAMPSFHVAWSLLAALALRRTVARPPLRLLIGLQPVAMGVAVIATGNHWPLDVVAGVALAVAAWCCAPVLVVQIARARARDAAHRPHPIAGRATYSRSWDRSSQSRRARRRSVWARSPGGRF